MLRKVSTFFSFVFVAVIMNGCTAVTVKPVDISAGVKNVCIEENPKVTIKNFLPVLQQGFQRHGVTTQVYSGEKPSGCDAVLTYTALRSWDFTTYLSHAELYLQKDGVNIASAEYHLRGKGGFSLMKWRGVKTKMDPVIDQLLKDY